MPTPNWQRGDAQVGALKLHYEVLGPERGEPLLLVMGLGSQLIQWPESLCRDLAARGFRVIRFDNRDVGYSADADAGLRFSIRGDFLRSRVGLPSGPSNYTLHDMVDDVVGLMDALGIARAHLAGVSMGGMISQIAAGRHPQRVASLTSIMSGTNHPRIRQTRLDLLLRLGNRPALATRDAVIEYRAETQRLIASPAWCRAPSVYRELAARQYDRAYRPGGVLRQTHAIIATGCFEDLLRTIRAPTQVIHGLQDPLLRPACGRRSAAVIPGARLEMIEGMAHDYPDELMPRWAELISGNAARGA